MFEKSTIFSAIFAFIILGIAGLKYMQFLENKNQVTQTSFISSLF